MGSRDCGARVIAFRVEDVAGNRTESRWRFHMTLRSPPLFYAKIPDGGWTLQPWDAASFALRGDGGQELHKAFATPGLGAQPEVVQRGLRLGRFEVTNPYGRSVAFAPSAGPELVLKTVAQRRYLREPNAPLCHGGSCGSSSQCRFLWQGSPGAGSCQEADLGQEPAVATTQPWAGPVEFAIFPMSGLDDPTAEELPRDGSSRVTLAAGESAVVDIVVDTAGSCAIGATEFTYHPPGVWTPVTRNLEVAGQECQTDGPTASDYARCVNSGTAPVPYCFEERHAAPQLLTELSLSPADGLLTVQVDHVVPGLTGQVPNATFEELNVTFTTTASGLPGHP